MNTNDNRLSCSQAKEWLPEGLKNHLEPKDQKDFDAHIAQCPDCRQDAAVTRQLQQWLHTDRAPNPGPEMQTRFFEMLYSIEQEEPISMPDFRSRLTNFFHFGRRPVIGLQIAFCLLLLGIGVVAGYRWREPNTLSDTAQQRIDTMEVQVQQMRRMMMLSLLENPSATERLQAVSLSAELDQADANVIDALLTTLTYDTNINVRLVTLDALTQYADNPQVREGLIRSLAHQDSPLVQMALADLMVKLQEKRSIKPLQQLFRQKGVRPVVKAKIEQSIKLLS
ncbi:HEAT repeat domain-containing protein [Runella sp.]|uniref:HEAT repeat domain-containing protein n=1 Tax=Runella sp. TaxID=1960881 RepID=UPI003D1522C7